MRTILKRIVGALILLFCISIILIPGIVLFVIENGLKMTLIIFALGLIYIGLLLLGTYLLVY